MADPINVASLHTLPLIGLNLSSPQWTNPSLFQDADLFFCSAIDLVSEAIEMVTHSIWSHVGMLTFISSVQEWYVVESVADAGVHMVPMSRYLTDYDGNGNSYDGSIVIARVSGLLAGQAVQTIDFAYRQLGKFYNKGEIAEILAKITLRIPTVRENNEKYICSELVWDSYNAAGIKLIQDVSGFVAPGDLWLDSRVTPVGALLFRS
jgi:uncharacterized protein YycO